MSMLANAAQHVHYDFRSIASLAFEAWKSGFDRTSKVLVGHSKGDLVLLSWFRKVDFQ